MTLDECRQATAHLAFVTELSDIDDTAEDAFHDALLRALNLTDGALPRRGEVTLSHFPPFVGAEQGEDGYVRYDLESLASDFATPAGLPLRLTEGGYTALCGGFFIEEDRYLSLPATKCGIYRLSYLKKPPHIPKEAEGDTEIPMPEEQASLLPLLVAYYLLLDEDGEKAQQYLAQYREMYSALLAKRPVIQPTAWATVNGW